MDAFFCSNLKAQLKIKNDPNKVICLISALIQTSTLITYQD